MPHALISALLALALFGGMLACLEFGRRLGLRRLAFDPEGAKTGTGAVDGAIFALLGLLIAFTFSSAASRFEHRRDLILQESNDIGTAYLRLDLLAEAPRDELRGLFRQYLDSRLRTYSLVDAADEAQAEYARSQELQGRIWERAVESCRAQAPDFASKLLLPALNAMFDTASARMAATAMHQPAIILWMLGLLALAGALLAGFSLATGHGRNWLHVVAFAAVMALTLYVILDLEYPRVGLIRVDAADELLRDVRADMR